MIGNQPFATECSTPTPSRRSISFFSPAEPPKHQLSDQEIIQQTMPLLLGLITSQMSAKNQASVELRGGVVGQVKDHWETLFWVGDDCAEAKCLASDSLGSGNIINNAQFAAIEVRTVDLVESLADSDSYRASKPLQNGVNGSSVAQELSPGLPNNAMLLSIDGKPAPGSVLRTTAIMLGRFLALHRDRQSDSRRLWQASTMLENAATWQQVDDDTVLLESIARCACEVLGCERSTIFLWDKARHRLVGRPAIGVEGGVLEVEDNAGVVGEVLQNGSPRWWSAGGDDGSRVNRRIDQAQNFRTHSLLAVPMFGKRNQVIGVFEAINVNPDSFRNGAFNASDVRTLSELSQHAAVAIESQKTRQNLIRSRDRLVEQAASGVQLIGNHSSIRELRENAAKIAGTELNVLILGNNGTGKEVLARHIHYESQRRSGPFVAVNCAALVESLLESELFGHEKGAFTDASESRPGKFELASGGTLFLDEVGDMSPGGQAKLLRVLEQRVVVRVGGSQAIPVDTRVIAATNQPLQELILERKFREDLFFRLNVVSLTLPPLAARGEDVLFLAEHFLRDFCSQIGRTVPTLDDAARRALLTHPWPGNVRELRNTIERVSYLCSGNTVSMADLMLPSASVRQANAVNAALHCNGEINLNDATRTFQIQHIQNTIARCDGNMTEAAATLGLHRSNLYRKMRQLGMPTSSSGSDQN